MHMLANGLSLSHTRLSVTNNPNIFQAISMISVAEFSRDLIVHNRAHCQYFGNGDIQTPDQGIDLDSHPLRSYPLEVHPSSLLGSPVPYSAGRDEGCDFGFDCRSRFGNPLDRGLCTRFCPYEEMNARFDGDYHLYHSLGGLVQILGLWGTRVCCRPLVFEEGNVRRLYSSIQMRMKLATVQYHVEKLGPRQRRLWVQTH